MSHSGFSSVMYICLCNDKGVGQEKPKFKTISNIPGQTNNRITNAKEENFIIGGGDVKITSQILERDI